MITLLDICTGQAAACTLNFYLMMGDQTMSYKYRQFTALFSVLFFWTYKLDLKCMRAIAAVAAPYNDVITTGTTIQSGNLQVLICACRCIDSICSPRRRPASSAYIILRQLKHLFIFCLITPCLWFPQPQPQPHFLRKASTSRITTEPFAVFCTT